MAENHASMNESSARAWLGEESTLIVAICAIALLRVLLLGAAFPLFNNVDEQAHFDLVRKYARLQLPLPDADRFDADTAELIVLYGSPEYLQDYGERAVPPPLWALSGPRIEAHIQALTARWTAATNYEAHAPPLYYFGAAAWLRLGSALGIEGGYEGYWLRLFNVQLLIALLLLAHRCCALLYPADRTLRLGVPLLIATMPQDAFHAINTDLPSALLGTMVLLACTRIALGGAARARFVWAGLCVAGAVLVKLSNLPLLPVFGLFAVWLAYSVREDPSPGLASLRDIGWMLAAALGPIALWLGWNAVVFGDPLAVGSKIAALGWQPKPLGALLEHPIFTPSGLATYLAGITRSFWRGEYVWAGVRIASGVMDAFFIATTVLFLGAAIFGRWLTQARPSAVPWITGSGFTLVIGAFLAFQAWLSTHYDFGGSWYPSSEEPFFISGRLALGALVPVFALFVEGLDRLLSPWRERVATLSVLVIFCFVMVLSELWLSRAVFASAYNFFHLP